MVDFLSSVFSILFPELLHSIVRFLHWSDFFTLSFLLSTWWQPWRWVFLSRKNLPLKCKDCKLIDTFWDPPQPCSQDQGHLGQPQPVTEQAQWGHRGLVNSVQCGAPLMHSLCSGDPTGVAKTFLIIVKVRLSLPRTVFFLRSFPRCHVCVRDWRLYLPNPAFLLLYFSQASGPHHPMTPCAPSSISASVYWRIQTDTDIIVILLYFLENFLNLIF